MAAVRSRKLHSTCKHSCMKCRSCDRNSLSVDTSQLSIQIDNTNPHGNSFENTPSPSSNASTTMTEQSTKFSHRVLSSTLKNDFTSLSVKRRSRADKLFHYTQMINRQYMMSMTKVLFRMQRELYKIKKRTHRIERLAVKQAQFVQPIIRIPRLTKDQLSTICVYNTNNESLPEVESISDDNNNNVNITDTTNTYSTKGVKRLKKQKSKKTTLKSSKKSAPTIWINNRQRPVDPNKYCSYCRHEFSKRANFIMHVKNIHKGIIPPLLNSDDQSLLEMNEEILEKTFNEHADSSQSEMTNDQSVVVPGDKSEHSQTSLDQWDISDSRLRPRTNSKPIHEPSKNAKIKCDTCNKFYRATYMKMHKRRAHPDQDISLSSIEINQNGDQVDVVPDKTPEHYAPSNGNPITLGGFDSHIANTPATITIADMDIDDVPIRFSGDTNKSIVIAVTCLEGYQLDLVEQFLEKFSSHVCQTTSIDSRTTHLITNDDKHSLRSPLSMKLIEAIAHHCFCVSYRWIIDCLKYDRIIGEESYEIEGDDTDALPHGGPRRSRLIPNRHALFQNICFMIKCVENPDIRMTNERLEDLITTCGGQIITCVTQRLLDKYQIIVLCDMLYVSERRHNYDQCRSLGIQFVSSDWVLESILEYRQKPFSLFEEMPL